MGTNIEHIDMPERVKQNQSISGILDGVTRFLMHFIEMCVVMCAGGITLNVLFFSAAARLGYPDLIRQYPELSILIIGILLSIAMSLWMLLRGHDWRMDLEMSGTSVLIAVLLIGASFFGFIAKQDIFVWMKSLVCPAMLIPMLLRLDHYAGLSKHSAHQHNAM